MLRGLIEIKLKPEYLMNPQALAAASAGDIKKRTHARTPAATVAAASRLAAPAHEHFIGAEALRHVGAF